MEGYRTTAPEYDAFEEIADFLNEKAADMPVHSPHRARVLKSAGMWGQLAGLRPGHMRTKSKRRPPLPSNVIPLRSA